MLSKKKLKNLLVFSLFFWVVFGLVVAACGASLIGKPIYKQFEVIEGHKWFEVVGEHGLEVLIPPLCIAGLLYSIIVFGREDPLSVLDFSKKVR